MRKIAIGLAVGASLAGPVRGEDAPAPDRAVRANRPPGGGEARGKNKTELKFRDEGKLRDGEGKARNSEWKLRESEGKVRGAEIKERDGEIKLRDYGSALPDYEGKVRQETPRPRN
jgi:hypothetical protein